MIFIFCDTLKKMTLKFVEILTFEFPHLVNPAIVGYRNGITVIVT